MILDAIARHEEVALMPHPRIDGKPLHPGERVYHRGRRETGRYIELDSADPSGETVWVEFADGTVMVSLSRLERAAGEWS